MGQRRRQPGRAAGCGGRQRSRSASADGLLAGGRDARRRPSRRSSSSAASSRDAWRRRRGELADSATTRSSSCRPASRPRSCPRPTRTGSATAAVRSPPRSRASPSSWRATSPSVPLRREPSSGRAAVLTAIRLPGPSGIRARSRPPEPTAPEPPHFVPSPLDPPHPRRTARRDDLAGGSAGARGQRRSRSRARSSPARSS